MSILLFCCRCFSGSFSDTVVAVVVAFGQRVASLGSVISRKFAASIGASQRDSGVRVVFFFLQLKGCCVVEMGFELTV